MNDDLIVAARLYLSSLAEKGAVVAVGGFDNCDPCVTFIAFPSDVRPNMEAFVKEYSEGAESDEDAEEVESEFGWGDHPLSDEDLDELAKDLVRDLRFSDLEEMAQKGKGYTVTVPLP